VYKISQLHVKTILGYRCSRHHHWSKRW